ncbi:hypothetical protein PtA15_4A838 [Puccinia triticina]|uniref:RxLR effector protein n=1 Tax=Puccinia triticina TaxID=208348 RepID=A0ABY7CH08_9BASI|nr:uncharacterized protein PtA15_4A838 [Puccinia triticina]WAQ84385.1 hypothetical protein PtA15_4A838 [Puccinia triticina]
MNSIYFLPCVLLLAHLFHVRAYQLRSAEDLSCASSKSFLARQHTGFTVQKKSTEQQRCIELDRSEKPETESQSGPSARFPEHDDTDTVSTQAYLQGVTDDLGGEIAMPESIKNSQSVNRSLALREAFNYGQSRSKIVKHIGKVMEQIASKNDPYLGEPDLLKVAFCAKALADVTKTANVAPKEQPFSDEIQQLIIKWWDKHGMEKIKDERVRDLMNILLHMWAERAQKIEDLKKQ